MTTIHFVLVGEGLPQAPQRRARLGRVPAPLRRVAGLWAAAAHFPGGRRAAAAMELLGLLVLASLLRPITAAAAGTLRAALARGADLALAAAAGCARHGWPAGPLRSLVTVILHAAAAR
jgi:hypothetical protein